MNDLQRARLSRSRFGCSNTPSPQSASRPTTHRKTDKERQVADGRGRHGVGEGNRIIRSQESLFLYKSFSTPCAVVIQAQIGTLTYRLTKNKTKYPNILDAVAPPAPEAVFPPAPAAAAAPAAQLLLRCSSALYWRYCRSCSSLILRKTAHHSTRLEINSYCNSCLQAVGFSDIAQLLFALDVPENNIDNTIVVKPSNVYGCKHAVGCCLLYSSLHSPHLQ